MLHSNEDFKEEDVAKVCEILYLQGMHIAVKLN